MLELHQTYTVLGKHTLNAVSCSFMNNTSTPEFAKDAAREGDSSRGTRKW